MEFELSPGIAFRTGTFSTLLAPEELVVPALNRCETIRRFMILFISGMSSQILPRLTPLLTCMDTCEAATADRVHELLAGAHQSIIFVEHDPSLYGQDAKLYAETYRLLRNLAASAVVIVYASTPDRSFDYLSHHADRAFYLLALHNHGTDRVQPGNPQLKYSRITSRKPCQMQLGVR
jgi:hypothetical protein